MSKHDIEAKINALLARAVDAGATEEERRTSASLAAKLMAKHGFAPRPSAEAASAGTPLREQPVAPAKPESQLETLLEKLRRREVSKSPAQRTYEETDRQRTELTAQAARLGYELGRRFAGKSRQ